MSMLKEFKSFAMKGNLIDLAVGFVMGAAFTAVSTKFIEGIVMPFISLIVQKDFSAWKFTLKKAEMDGDTIVKPEIAILYGDFISAIIYFLIVAFVMFMVVKAVNAMKRKEEEAPAAPPAPPADVVLLTEIRDLLKK